jgi:hypothetical protein
LPSSFGGICGTLGFIATQVCAAASGTATARRNRNDEIDAANFMLFSIVFRNGDVLCFILSWGEEMRKARPFYPEPRGSHGDSDGGFSCGNVVTGAAAAAMMEQ